MNTATRIVSSEDPEFLPIASLSMSMLNNSVSSVLMSSSLSSSFARLQESLLRHPDAPEIEGLLAEIAVSDCAAGAACCAALTSGNLCWEAEFAALVQQVFSQYPLVAIAEETKSVVQDLENVFRTQAAKLQSTRQRSLELLDRFMNEAPISSVSSQCAAPSDAYWKNCEQQMKCRMTEQIFQDALRAILAQIAHSLQDYCRAEQETLMQSSNAGHLACMFQQTLPTPPSLAEIQNHLPFCDERTVHNNYSSGYVGRRAEFGSTHQDLMVRKAESAEPEGAVSVQSNFAPGSASKTKKLPKAAVEYFKKWMVDHCDNPYPSEDEKAEFCQQFSITVAQVNNWFINSRVRTWRPLMKQMAGKTEKMVKNSQQEDLCKHLQQRLYGRGVGRPSNSSLHASAVTYS
eukprot:ANDGO_04943.mRNA.1 Homeobox protein unc-62